MDASMSCVFCAIVAGEAPAALVHRDGHCTVFLDIHPLQRGHALIVPNLHAVRLQELPEESRRQLYARADTVMAAMTASALAPAGFNLLLNDGPAANQSVPHVHLHVIPRRGGDLGRLLLGCGRRLSSHLLRRTSYPELEATAQAIRAGFARSPSVDAGG
jgi:histidine triad (HIT) family protein